MLHKYFSQDKFDKQISKAFDYMSKFNMNEEEMFKRQLDNKNIRDFAIQYAKAKNGNFYGVDLVEAHLRTPVDKLPDGRNEWTQNNVFHLISLWLLAYNPTTHKYDKYIKQQISNKYNIPQNKITDRVNKFINETLNIDKYNLLQDDLFTYEELKNYKNRKLN